MRWARPGLIGLLVVTALAYLWNLEASGYANSFYAAAVQAGTKSWKAMLFGSIDSSNFITVDKSPGSLWVMELSGRIFGFSSLTMLVPQVLEGVAAVGLVYTTVKRRFGGPAGLLAGAVLACTPVAALMFRFNNPDAFMVLLLVGAAYTLTRALEKAGTKWIVAAGVLIGFAFLAKMLQAFTVLPAFAGVYLLAAPTGLGRRVWHLALGAGAVVVSAGWWVATVALWPVASRPFVDGSPDNSILNLIFGYNGLGRLSGGSGGSGGGGNFSGTAGVFRLFNDLMGGQASWLIPASLVVLVAGLVQRGRAPRTDPRRAALILWGGWLIVTGVVFSLSSGVIHSYYTVALAPAIAALIGVGGALLWEGRSRGLVRLVGSAVITVTAVWAFVLLDRTPTYVPWLRVVIAAAAAIAVGALLAAPFVPRATRSLIVVAIGFGLAASLAGPIAYTVTTLRTPHTGSIPSAGPAVTSVSGAVSAARAGGPGGPGGPGGFGGPGGSGGAGGFGGAGGTRPTTGGTRPTGTSAALNAALRSDAGSYRWVAAIFGSQSAATLELSTGDAVMAIGGFNGEGGNITLAQFEGYVAKGEIHYFIASGTGAGGGGGPGGVTNSDSAITAWVEAHFTSETIGGQTVYVLTSRK